MNDRKMSRVETLTLLVKMAQEETGERQAALLAATKALGRCYVHSERYKAVLAARALGGAASSRAASPSPAGGTPALPVTEGGAK